MLYTAVQFYFLCVLSSSKVKYLILKTTVCARLTLFCKAKYFLTSTVCFSMCAEDEKTLCKHIILTLHTTYVRIAVLCFYVFARTKNKQACSCLSLAVVNETQCELACTRRTHRTFLGLQYPRL